MRWHPQGDIATILRWVKNAVRAHLDQACNIALVPPAPNLFKCWKHLFKCPVGILACSTGGPFRIRASWHFYISNGYHEDNATSSIALRDCCTRFSLAAFLKIKVVLSHSTVCFQFHLTDWQYMQSRGIWASTGGHIKYPWWTNIESSNLQNEN